MVPRQLGPRSLDEVPPLEFACLLLDTAVDAGWNNTDALFRATLRRLGRDRLSAAARVTMTRALESARELGERR